MPRGRSLYGSLPEQLEDPSSFARQLQAILAVRERYGIATSRQMDVPDVSHKSMLVLVHQLAEPDMVQLTVLNFSAEPISGTVRSEFLSPGSLVKNLFSDEELAIVDDLSSFHVEMGPHEGWRCWSRVRPWSFDFLDGRPPRPGRRPGDPA